MRDWTAMIPEFTLRHQQLELLDRSADALDAGIRTLVLEAPPGVGKSIVALGICRYVGGTGFIVTPQRVLQDQLGQLPGVAVMKGRGSYTCNVTDDTAGDAPCLDSQRDKYRPECTDDACHYYRAFAEAQAAPIVAHSYAGILSQGRMSGAFAPRDVLCMDEGHTAGGWLRRYFEMSVSDHMLGELSNRRLPSPEHFMRWLVEVLPAENAFFSRALSMLIRRMRSEPGVYGIDTDDDSGNIKWKEPIVPWHVERRGQGYFATPIRVAPMASALTSMGRIRVIISATILDDRMLLGELGIKSSDATFIRVGSGFDPSQRPTIRRFVGKMNRESEQRLLPSMVRALAGIAMDHAEERGIVHTTSYEYAKRLCELWGEPRAVLLPQGANRDEVIGHFLSGAIAQNAILIGPGLCEGIDGYGEACRWQAITKIPWPNMGDPVAQYLKTTVPGWVDRWVTWKASQQTVQAIGRVCRHPEDYGTTYILDAGFDRLLRSGQLPQHVLDAVE